MSSQRIVKSPKENVGALTIIDVQEASTELKTIIVEGVTSNRSQNEIYSKAVDVIKRYLKLIPDNLKDQFTRSMTNLVRRDYTLFKMNIDRLNASKLNDINSLGYNFTTASEVIQAASVTLRGKATNLSKGQALIADYRKQVREQLRVLSAQPSMFVSVKNGKPYKMSMRNLAEMTTRYEANIEDVAKLQSEGIDLVWTSSHVDASARCEPYQGKLYSISGKQAGKIIDGNKVYNLEEALQGPKKDGNGIINGYNCRHYLIPYERGSKAPRDYNAKQIREERVITTRQRQYENMIRQLKVQQQTAIASNDTELANLLSKRWHRLFNKYRSYSLQNGRAYYPWRTQVARDEVIEPNQTALKITEQEVNRLEKEAKEKIEDKVGSEFKLPKKLLDLSKVNAKENYKIHFRHRGDHDGYGGITKRSASRHILDDHERDVNEEFLSNIKKTLNNPQEVIKDSKEENKYYLRTYLYSKEKTNNIEDKYMFIVVNKDTYDKDFKIITTFIKTFKKNKK